MMVEGDLLESIITEGRADIRPLGRSDMVRVRNRSLITLTGNNPIITGDMARRTLVLDISPRSADPERDRYEFNPTEMVGRRRTDFLRAAFIAMRAFRLAGMPRRDLPAVGSFDEWSRRVRDLVDWLPVTISPRLFGETRPRIRSYRATLPCSPPYMIISAPRHSRAPTRSPSMTGNRPSAFAACPTGADQA